MRGKFAAIFAIIAAVIGLEHVDALWPTSLLPNGIPIGEGRQVEGLLTLGDSGRPPRLALPEALRADWELWVGFDQRQDSSECLPMPEDVRKQLVERGHKRRDAGGAVQYWVTLKVDRRFGPARCSPDGGLQVNRSLAGIEAIKPVPCNRDVFVAHGFQCPGERRARLRQSETVVDIADYYPDLAARSGAQGTSRVRVERDETGSPVACAVLASSGSDSLDRQTCKLVGTDPYFTRVPSGPNDIANPLTQSITWRLAE